MEYILKVWLCTCLVASLITLLYVGINANGFGVFMKEVLLFNTISFIGIYIATIGISFLCYIPTFIILFLITFFYSNKLNIKLILKIAGVIGTFLSFYIIFNSNLYFDFDGIIWVLIYSVCISFFIWFFKIETLDKSNSIKNPS